jgi:uncharacterized protein (DUF2141 family)
MTHAPRMTSTKMTSTKNASVLTLLLSVLGMGMGSALGVFSGVPSAEAATPRGDAQTKLTLTVRLNKLKRVQGQMVFAVFANEATYKAQKNPVFQGRFDVKTTQTQFAIEGVKPGTYGVVVYQDLNKNGKLDSGMFGPTEPFGFSRNPKIGFGAPDFKDVVFRVDSTATITIDMNRTR